MMPNPFKQVEFEAVMARAPITPGMAILDFGCGRGNWTVEMARRGGRAVGVDIAERSLETARRYAYRLSPDRARFVLGSLPEAGLPDSSFDLAVSLCVLEHIPNLSAVLETVRRLLKPGGVWIASVDALGTMDDPALLEKHRRDHGVAQYFTPETLRERFEAAGFVSVTVAPILTGPAALAEFKRRIRGPRYKAPIWRRWLLTRRFREEDRRGGSATGLMLIGRGERPAQEESSGGSL
jgi:SAM-dependent methyltransferase